MRRAVLVLFLLAAACQDKAKADYDRCVDLDKNYDVKGAAAACSAAVAADSKSPSGQAAAKKLLDLQSVSDKLKAENADKAARDAILKKDQPELLPVATATETVAPAPTELAADAGADEVVAVAHALYVSGDYAGARKILDPRVLGKGVKGVDPFEANLLADVCTAQQDRKCGAALVALARKARR
ncbi:MAG TPA: hypothetical protein VGH28_01545 [Polyangiaceae bacterium]|jgi:hypothetical protein